MSRKTPVGMPISQDDAVQFFVRTDKACPLGHSRLSSTSILAICLPGMTIRPTKRDVISALLACPVAFIFSTAAFSSAWDGNLYSNELDKIMLLPLSVQRNVPENNRPSGTVTCIVFPSRDS